MVRNFVASRKLFVRFVALCTLLLLLAGCANQETVPSIEVVESTVTRSGMTYIPRVDKNHIWMEGSIFTLERLVDGVWESVPPTASMIFSTELLLVHSGEECTVDWGSFYGALAEGTYRLVKEYWQYSGQLDENGLPNADFDLDSKTVFTCYGEFVISASTEK